MNLEKLDAAIAHIEAHPEQWRQHDWFYRGDNGCGTTACLAGTVALLDGWLPADWRPDPDGAHHTAVAVKDGREELVSIVARAVLALDYPTANRLFDGTNTLEDIKRFRNQIAAGEL